MHVLNNLRAYILNMELVIEPFDDEDILTNATIEENKNLPIGKAFRRITPREYATIFSSDKSIMRGPAYGGDVNEYTKYVSELADALLSDKPFNHNNLVDNRAEVYIRDLFIDKTGEPIEPVNGISRLKDQSIRLADGLELRSLHPHLGLHTHHNSNTARMVLKDLDVFFKESCIDYQEYRTDRRGSVHFWET